MVQERGRVVLIAGTLIPNETLAEGEIVGTVPVDALSQRATAAQTPSGFAFGRPRVAHVHVAVQMGFIDIEQANFLSAKPCKQASKRFNKGRTALRVGFAQDLLAFLPTQVASSHDPVQGAQAAGTAQGLPAPTVQLFQRPGMTGQAVVKRVGLGDRVNDAVELLLGKKGRRPPVRR